ncbi:Protein brambleberry, partial [Armadillidium nasatum]
MILEKQQEELSSAQVGIRNFVSSNIRDLTREKRLIASGQKELAQITLAIKKKLEDAQQQLQYQGEGQRNTHQKILKDLSDIQDSASRVWGQIDESTKAILHNHEQTVAQYSRLMNDLQKMNSTVHHLMDILLKMRVKIEEKFSWISSLVGDTVNLSTIGAVRIYGWRKTNFQKSENAIWDSKSNIPSLQKLEFSSCEEYEGDDTSENRYEA